jgi:hypothetical protein
MPPGVANCEADSGSHKEVGHLKQTGKNKPDSAPGRLLLIFFFVPFVAFGAEIKENKLQLSVLITSKHVLRFGYHLIP